MDVLAQVCAAVSAVILIAVFPFEAFLIDRPWVQRFLGIEPHGIANVHLWSFCIGVRNALAGIGALVGLWIHHYGDAVDGHHRRGRLPGLHAALVARDGRRGPARLLAPPRRERPRHHRLVRAAGDRPARPGGLRQNPRESALVRPPRARSVVTDAPRGAPLTALQHPPPDHAIDPWSPAQRARLVRLCAAVVGPARPRTWRRRRSSRPGASGRSSSTRPVPTPGSARSRATSAAATSASTATTGPSPPTRVPEQRHRDLDRLEREDVVDLLERALALLPEATSAALVGHYVDELSHAEIAERIGTTADAVSMRVSRGRARLRHLLETEFRDQAEGPPERAGGRPGCPAPTAAARAWRCAATTARSRFRCRWCDGGDLSSRLTLDSPAFARLVGDVDAHGDPVPPRGLDPDVLVARRTRAACAATRPSPRGVRPRRRDLVGAPRLGRRVHRLRRGGQQLRRRPRAVAAGGARGPPPRAEAAVAAGARRRTRRAAGEGRRPRRPPTARPASGSSSSSRPCASSTSTPRRR